MRIKVINPNTTQSMTDKIGACARDAARAGTEIVAVSPAMGPVSIESHYDEALAVPGLLAEIAAGLGLSARDVIAVGDGANDLDMLTLAGSGVAVHAKPSVAAAAPMRVDHADLTALLYIQGYRQQDFVT